MEEDLTIEVDYETEYKKLQERLKYEREEITHEWQNKFQSEQERISEIINKLEDENKFYKKIIKSVLHIKEDKHG